VNPRRLRAIQVADICCSIQARAVQSFSLLKPANARLIAPSQKVVLREWPYFEVEGLYLGCCGHRFWDGSATDEFLGVGEKGCGNSNFRVRTISAFAHMSQ